TAPTGIGKTEAFLLPLVSRYFLEKKESGIANYNGGVKVLAIYPTKALATDQFDKFKEILSHAGLRVEMFTGDTSKGKRSIILADPPEILITNMDILHYNLRKQRFRQILFSLETVIIDECHTYQGLLGTNLRWVLERLERIVDGECFQIIAASATVANAEEFVSLLARRKVKGCHCNQGRKTDVTHALVTRSLDDSDNPLDLKFSKAKFVALLTSLSLSKVLVFEDSRRGAEELFETIERVLLNVPAENRIRTGVHHAGIPYYNRQKTEKAFKDDQIDLLIATPTMEVGIDIGGIDIIVSNPVPVNRLLQRFGRGGRRGQSCLAVTDLSSDNPINEYYKKNPRSFLGSASPVYFDVNSEKIAFYQVLAAAVDHPIILDENFYKNHEGTIKELIEVSFLEKKPDNSLIATEEARSALKNFNLRGIENSVDIVLIKTGVNAKSAVITSREIPLAIREFHPESTVRIGGQLYLTKKFNLERKIAYVTPFPKTRKRYYTRAVVSREIIPDRSIKPNIEESTPISHLTDVKIINTVSGYTKHEYNRKKILTVDLDEWLRHEIKTRGLIINVAKVLSISGLDYDNDSWHGLAHLILIFAELMIGVRGMSDVEYCIYRDMLLIHENTTGGRGIVMNIQRNLSRIIEKGIENLKGCECSRGCPKCLFLHHCKEKNARISKQGTIKLASDILTALKEIN
ncbi:MAG: DEAD/DEAH box helicase, partial [Candidatus Odinarchaeota archaeon]